MRIEHHIKNYNFMNRRFLAIIAVSGALFLQSCKKEVAANTQEVVTTDSAGNVAVKEIDSAKVNAADSVSGNADTAHNSQNSVDWMGTYEATIPCADCPGIKTTLTLNKDNTFTISEEYLERKTKSEDKGNFSWDTTGSTITLNGKNAKYKYKVGENRLFQLNMDGTPITTEMKDLYIFKKK